MIAGRELDALVAEKVMGREILTQQEMEEEALRVWQSGQLSCRSFMRGFWAEPGAYGYGDGLDFTKVGRVRQEFPRYSENIAAAWDVVEKLCDSVESVRVLATVDGTVVTVNHYPGGPRLVKTDALSAPLAICLAALAAVGVKVPA
jgi:hypothetical protein